MESPRDGTAGSCYGYEVRSSLPFRYLRSGGGGVPLEVTEQDRTHEPPGEPLLEWTRQPGHELHAKVYADGTGYWLWTDLEGWFQIDPVSALIGAPPCPDTVRRE